MKILKNKNNRTVAAALLLVIAAYVLRFVGMYVYFPKLCGILRSFIYIGLFVFWGFSLRVRIIQKQVRRYLTAAAALMVFWFVIRTVKFNFLSETMYPDVRRYLWYFYYLPMLFIPVLTVLVALFIRQPEDHRQPKLTKLICIPPALLFLLVITNDLHQKVFTFPDDAEVWTDSDNGYAIGYFLVVGSYVVCAFAVLVLLFKKCRIPGSRKRILLPCIPVCAIIVYIALYGLDVQWLRFICGDVTAFICLMYAAALEICIQCGFIQANTKYMELFDASTVGVQITDDDYNVILSSKAARSADRQLLRLTENGAVMLDDGIRLSGAPIHGGHVVWYEDMSDLIAVLEELNEAKEELEDSNEILEEENAVKAREAHIAEQDRLYNIIGQETAKQISLMDTLIRQAENSADDNERVRLLRKMLFIGAYLKRRSNLVFLADKKSVTEARELALTFRESLENLEMYGVTCGFHCNITEPVPVEHIMSMYDFFEDVTELSLDKMSCLTVFADKEKERFALVINTDSSARLDCLACENVTAVKDEDGEWQLSLRIGGDTVEQA
ncbi:MAG: histidine kinase N-terminal 7TM domain-containing protein [Oscillospiraceae bacterium]